MKLASLQLQSQQMLVKAAEAIEIRVGALAFDWMDKKYIRVMHVVPCWRDEEEGNVAGLGKAYRCGSFDCNDHIVQRSDICVDPSRQQAR